MSNKASNEFLLSTLACVHTLLNQHIWVQSKHHFFTKSDRFTNTVWTGLTSVAAGDSLDHSGFLKFEQKSLLSDNDGWITGLHVSSKPFWLRKTWPAPERHCWGEEKKRLDLYLENIRNMERSAVIQPRRGLFKLLRHLSKPSLTRHNEAKALVAPSQSPPRRHFWLDRASARRPATFFTMRFYLHMRDIPDVNVNHIHFVINML